MKRTLCISDCRGFQHICLAVPSRLPGLLRGKVLAGIRGLHTMHARMPNRQADSATVPAAS